MRKNPTETLFRSVSVGFLRCPASTAALKNSRGYAACPAGFTCFPEDGLQGRPWGKGVQGSAWDVLSPSGKGGSPPQPVGVSREPCRRVFHHNHPGTECREPVGTIAPRPRSGPNGSVLLDNRNIGLKPDSRMAADGVQHASGLVGELAQPGIGVLKAGGLSDDIQKIL